MQFLQPAGLVSLGVISGELNQAGPGVPIAKVVCGANTHPCTLHRHCMHNWQKIRNPLKPPTTFV